MTKSISFADKMAKKAKASTNTCPVCNGEYKRVKSVKYFQSDSSGSWKFSQKMVNLCKCNEKEVYSL